MLGLLRYAAITGLAIALPLAFGCGTPADPPAPTSPIRQIDTSALPPLGDYTPPLDGGRIEMACPAGWELASRTKGYEARFQANPDDPYPMILVKSGDGASEPLTAENVVAFASKLASDNTAQPVAVGQLFGALQIKRGKEPNTVDRILERLIVTTVLGGRVYTLELRTRQDQLREHQDSLFAVVASMRLGDAAATETESKESTPQTEEAVRQEPTSAETGGTKASTDASQKELDEIFE